jgi:hypothetical protein
MGAAANADMALRHTLIRRSALLAALCAALGSVALADDAAFTTSIHPIIQDFCLGCHSSAKHKGDFDLEVHASPAALQNHPQVWQRVLEQLADGEMPPDGKPQPSTEQKARLVAWARQGLDAVALTHAGDPGPVVLRRLSNAEYTYTIRDATGVEALDPAHEFPVDGAAGEGFTNTGQALVMSPSLISKFLDAGKAVASHAVFLPDGLRFSPHTSRRDWTEEMLSEIRSFYAGFTDQGGTDTVTLQGIVLDKNLGGRLPLEKYLRASLDLRAPGSDPEAVARTHGLNARYLATLVTLLRGSAPSPILDSLRMQWMGTAGTDVGALSGAIAEWQKALWTFNGIGQIGKKGGPARWMSAISPLRTVLDAHLKITPAPASTDVAITLRADPADGDRSGDIVEWKEPRLLIPGQPPLLLRDARAYINGLLARRDHRIAMTAKALMAAADVMTAPAAVDLPALAAAHGVDSDALSAWLGYLGIDRHGEPALALMKDKLPTSGKYDFVKGWGSPDLPSLWSNASDQAVRIPGVLKPHGVVVHPSPSQAVAVGWCSPIAGSVQVSATITHAHPECGNGVHWALEVRRGASRLRLASGDVQGAKPASIGPLDPLRMRPGDLISVIIAPRGGSHACALTDIEFTIARTPAGAPLQEWSLTREVADDVLSGNPHADHAGHQGVWQFYTEPLAASADATTIPAGSLLARWLAADSDAVQASLATDLQTLLSAPPPSGDGPDAVLARQLTALKGPLCRAGSPSSASAASASDAGPSSAWGADPAAFGRRPDGSAIEAASLCVQAPASLTIHLPADLVAGSEFVTSGALDPVAGTSGSVRLQAVVGEAGPATHAMPIIVADSGPTRERFTAACDEFRRVFPASLCYTKIVPVDEVITLSLFYREDDQLCRLMLDDQQHTRLDRLWDQLHYISQDALAEVDAFEQLWQYATQDGDPSTLEPLRKPILDRAAAFRQRLMDTQPRHLDAVIAFAEQVYRRPLAARERSDLSALYTTLRDRELPHEEAIRLLVARVLVSPDFLYRTEKSKPGTSASHVDAWELASRLSYFLWSSQPDDELRALAASGRLLEPDVLAGQARRLMHDPRIRRAAIEFGCAWLHITDFDALDEKSETAFPTFISLRGSMYEEAIRFFTDFLQHDRPGTSLLDADYSFLNEDLAKHYGIADVNGAEFRRVDGMHAHGRGGILGLAATLSKASGASRTSPILRGNWVAEALLGDRLPRPPKDVPPLPADEANETLTVRQLTEKHVSDPRCAGCHIRIDAFGFALEGYDAIGRFRTADAGNRPIDAKATTRDGSQIDGLEGLRGYLLGKRREAFFRQFSRKLLGFALGRSVQLSDQPLVDALQAQLATDGGRIGMAIEMIVRSPQFRDIRGRDMAFEQ